MTRSPTWTVAKSGDAVNWRLHLGPFEVELGGLDGGFGGLDLRGTRPRRLLDVIELLGTYYALRHQCFIAVQILFVLEIVGLLLRQVALCLIERRLVVAVIDLEEQLAGLHRMAILVDLLEQIALHARMNLRIDEAQRGPDPFGVYRHVFLDDLGYEDGRRRRGRDGFMTSTQNDGDSDCDGRSVFSPWLGSDSRAPSTGRILGKIR